MTQLWEEAVGEVQSANNAREEVDDGVEGEHIAMVLLPVLVLVALLVLLMVGVVVKVVMVVGVMGVGMASLGLEAVSGARRSGGIWCAWGWCCMPAPGSSSSKTTAGLLWCHRGWSGLPPQQPSAYVLLGVHVRGRLTRRAPLLSWTAPLIQTLFFWPGGLLLFPYTLAGTARSLLYCPISPQLR